MNLAHLRKMRLVNLVVCLAFCLNFVFSNSALAFAKVEKASQVSMLRESAAKTRIENAVLGMGVDLLSSIYKESGAKGLKAKLADLSLDKAIDPLEVDLIVNGIGVLEREGKVFVVCLIGKGWKLDLSEVTGKPEPFESAEKMNEFISSGQLTWFSGEYTPTEIIDAQAATKAYLRKAGDEKRIFAEENLKEQVAKYSADPKIQEEVLKRLEAAFAFHKKTIDSITQEELIASPKGMFPGAAVDVVTSLEVNEVKKSLEKTRQAIVLDKENAPSFYYKGKVDSSVFLAVTASSGGFKYEGYDYAKAGQVPPRSIYSNLAMVEAYMKMAETDPEALTAYKAKLLHEYFELTADSKLHRQESQRIVDLINKYDKMTLDMWKEREAGKARTKLLEEENKKTIAEATSANIGKFLKGGVIPAELINVAEVELQKLVASGLLTGYRTVIKDGKIFIFTTRQNSKAIEDDAAVPSKILNVYLSVLNFAKEKGIYSAEDLTGKSYRQQAEALEISAPLPTLTYLEPEGWAKLSFGKIRTELKVPEGQPKEFFTHDVHTYTIAELFVKPLEQIPDAVVAAVRGKLDQDIAQGKLLGAVVNDFGATEIEIHVTHRYGELNAAVQRLMLEAMKAGVLKAQELGLLRKEIDVISMSLDDLAKALRVKYEPHSITERGAEPIVIAKMIGAGIGAADIKLYHEFFMPGSTPLQKLGFVPEVGDKDKPGVRGFRAIVRRTEDVLKGNFDGPVWEFEKSAACTVKGKFYPSKDESLELLALASQPNDFQITAIYTVEGSTITSTEPIVSVVYQPVYGEKGKLRTLNPTFICRSQSGADAVGGVASMFYDVNFVPGGPQGENFVTTRPVTLQEARKAPQEGTAHVVIYGWQSKGNGIIPRETGGILDHVAINPPALQYNRTLANWLAAIMTTHKNDQPYIAPFATQERSEPLRKAQSQYFRPAPKEAQVDTFMNEVEAKVASGEFLSVTDDKADMGGKFGHNFTPEYMLAIDKATVLEAIENGALSDGNIIGFVNRGRLINGTTPSIGDDSHVLMLGDKTRNSAEAHQLSFLAFTRGYYAAVVNGEKPYGLAQDYQGKEAKAAKANPIFYSHFTPRFFEILREVMPTDYMGMVDKMEAGWKEWLVKGKETTVLPEPFSGNVSQQGIGSARYLVNIAGGERTFGMLAGDKMGPAALNRIIREGVYAALDAGKFKNGLVFEIWDAKAFDEHGNIPIEELPKLFEDIADAITALKDQAEQDFVKGCYYEGSLKDMPLAAKEHLAQLLKKAGYVPSKRIFLDAQEDKEAIFIYFADSDRFNIKQVWDKKQAGWDINNPEGYLTRPILGSSVTKLGILAGGEYIGKDDPVMVGNSTLMDYIFAFLKDNPVLLQGDMNGSHWLAGIPTAFKYAVANAESHPILVGLRYTLSEDGKTMANVEDVFGSKAYSSIRKKMIRFNYEFKRACLGGQVEPYGTNWRTVEASYPLAKFLRALQAPNSRFLVKNKPAAERKSRPIGLFGEVVALFKTATGSLDLPSAPEGWIGADESAERFLKSALALQNKGISHKHEEAVFVNSKDAANKKVVLVNLGVLESDPSLILALANSNEQRNQRLGVFGSTANIDSDAYRIIGIADAPGLKTAKDVENLFAGIAKETKNGASANKEMFAKIQTQNDMYEGEISDAASLLKQLERIGISKSSLAGFIGPSAWAENLKQQTDVPTNVVLGIVEAKDNEVAFAANAFYGIIEAIASPDKKLTPAIAERLDLLVLTTTSMAVRPKEITNNIKDVITEYRETVAKI